MVMFDVKIAEYVVVPERCSCERGVDSITCVDMSV